MSLESRLARRLDKLESHLAFVVSLHLFVEHLLDALIRLRSPRAQLILDDHRTYSFSVKLMLVFHMGFLPEILFENLRSLNSLRNQYAHEIDVDLARSLARMSGQMRRPDGVSVFGSSFDEKEQVDLSRLHQLREPTFGWLHDRCREFGAVG